MSYNVKIIVGFGLNSKIDIKLRSKHPNQFTFKNFKKDYFLF
ncbi:hypothetical protein HNP96_001836 [Methanococcus maripaludis]|uniref:Uncharacterized protein n=1 Tax=Methanococcus maripaludis TaxID=39152 RepID=A0A7J9SCF7_METMI|nr:hypothetical protein [Methanococcus maripaludis]